MSVHLVLPWPPTTNNLFRSGDRGRRFSTREAKAYVQAVWVAVVQQRQAAMAGKGMSGSLGVEIVARPPPGNRVRDLDNMLKAPLDGLKKAGVIEDDGLIDRLSIRRGLPVIGGELEVRIEQIGGLVVEDYEPIYTEVNS